MSSPSPINSRTNVNAIAVNISGSMRKYLEHLEKQFRYTKLNKSFYLYLLGQSKYRPNLDIINSSHYSLLL